MKRFTTTLFALSLVATSVPSLRADDTDAKPDAAKTTITKPDSAACCDAAMAAPEKTVFTADTAFAFLKTMAGNWKSAAASQGHYGKGDVQQFRVSAAGSAVVNTIFPGEESEMVSVFHRDNKELLLTHYCAIQNVPIMKFEKSDQPGVIKFVFSGGTNFDPAIDAHVHEGTIVVKDTNTVESTFVAYANNKPMPGLKSVLKREESKQAASLIDALK